MTFRIRMQTVGKQGFQIAASYEAVVKLDCRRSKLSSHLTSLFGVGFHHSPCRAFAIFDIDTRRWRRKNRVRVESLDLLGNPAEIVSILNWIAAPAATRWLGIVEPQSNDDNIWLVPTDHAVKTPQRVTCVHTIDRAAADGNVDSGVVERVLKQ